MRDASCRLLTVLFDILAEESVEASELLRGTTLSLDDVQDESSWIAWADMMVILARAAAVCGSREELQARTARLLWKSSGNRTLTAVGRMLTGPKSLYKAQARWISRQLFSMLDWEYEDMGPGRVRMTVRYHAGYEVAPELPYMVAATLWGLPTLLGYPGADLTWTTKNRSVIYEISCASSRSWLARIRRLVRAILAPNAVAGELEAQANQLTLRVQELSAAREEAASASQLKSEFLSMVSHELRTPLNGILGATDVLVDQGLRPDQVELVAAARSSARRLSELIVRILDFTEMSAAVNTLAEEAIDPAGIADMVAHELADEVARQRATLVVRAAHRPAAIGDPRRLSQVLKALMENAVRHTPGGRVSVEIESMADQGLWWVEVRDNGLGMDASTLARLTEPFTQGDGSHSRPFGGIGLGLAVVKRVVEAMGGSMVVRSAPGEGCVVQVSVRMRPCSRPFAPLATAGTVRVVSKDEAARTELAEVVEAAGGTVVESLPSLGQCTTDCWLVTDEPAVHARAGGARAGALLTHIRTVYELRRQLADARRARAEAEPTLRLPSQTPMGTQMVDAP